MRALAKRKEKLKKIERKEMQKKAMRHGKEGKVNNFDIWFNKQHRKKKEQKEG